MSRHDLPQDYSITIDITLLGKDLLVEKLRGHPRHCAYGLSLKGSSRHWRRRLFTFLFIFRWMYNFRDSIYQTIHLPKVTDFNVKTVIHQTVVTLQISMQDLWLLAMQVVHTLCNINGYLNLSREIQINRSIQKYFTQSALFHNISHEIQIVLTWEGSH